MSCELEEPHSTQGCGSRTQEEASHSGVKALGPCGLLPLCLAQPLEEPRTKVTALKVARTLPSTYLPTTLYNGLFPFAFLEMCEYPFKSPIVKGVLRPTL